MNPQPYGTEVAGVSGIDVILSFIVGTPSGAVLRSDGLAPSSFRQNVSASGPLGPTG